VPQLEQERLEGLIGPVDLIDQQHAGCVGADRLEEWPFEQVALGEDVLLLLRDAALVLLQQLDGEQLALVVPFVHRRVRIETFVALQPDQACVTDLGQHLGHLGLADAGIAFEQ